ncbi:sulfotransferase [Spirillospora sp. CA-294931]|uniref:sulfotransferase n=1 Tax=Spirillospora sp. CA-294931 TaxID=3240042 RepID=UPI003D91AF63
MTVTVLSITGWCRSGSTVLGNVLAEAGDVVHAGELRFLWLNGVLGAGGNGHCGCGEDLVACALWSRVLDAVCPPHRTLERHAADVTNWQDSCRTRHTWRVLSRPPANGRPATLAAAYRAIAAETGARVIVDSSKFASDAALLTHLPGVRPVFVHLVRDPRAVAHSWRRPKQYTGRRSAADSTRHWAAFNLAAEAVNRARPGASLTLRYEDLMTHPRAAVGRVLEMAGHTGPSPVAEDGTVELGGNHAVTGNPNRFERGRTALAEDRRRLTALPRRQGAAATLLALPLLRRYRYEMRF